MSTIPIREIPGSVGTPSAKTLLVMDNGISMSRTTVQAVVEAGRPVASEAEARAGTDNSKVMTALRVSQAVSSIGNPIFVPRNRTVSAGQGLAGGGALDSNISLALNSTSIASLLLADTSVQPGDLSSVATSGAYSDLTGKPVLGTAAATDVTDYAPAAKGVPSGGTAGQVLGAGNGTVREWVDAGAGDMNRAVYDPQNISADAFDRANHTGTQAISTVDGLQDALDGAGADSSRDLTPAYLEQFLTGFYGRGMLSAETDSMVTEQFFAATEAAGDTSIVITDGSDFAVGSTVTILHDNGKYWSYFVRAVSTNTLSITPSLKWPCTSGVAKIERTWWNRAHPGKFYMRHLAQRVAHELSYESEVPQRGRLAFTQVLSASDTNDILTAVGSATVSYFDEANIAQSNIQYPNEFNIGRTAFINPSAIGAGARTASWAVDGCGTAILRFSGMTRSPFGVSIYVRNQDGKTLLEFPIPVGQDGQAARQYSIPFSCVNAREVYVEFLATEAGDQRIIVDQIDIFPSYAPAKPLIAKTAVPPKILGYGDSWVAGNEVGSPERESILTQLALELPFANIVNAGIGGATALDLLNNFDTDVVPERPDYVLVTVGTNDAYNPSMYSATFDPNAIDGFCSTLLRLINRIQSIGAKPIIIGVPALAEADAGSGMTDWELNNHAKKYSRFFYARLAKTNNEPEVVSSGGATCIKYPDGRMECYVPSLATADTNTAIGVLYSSDPVTWNFPASFASPPVVTPNQLISSARVIYTSSVTTGSVVFRQFSPVQSAVAGIISATAIGRWK